MIGRRSKTCEYHLGCALLFGPVTRWYCLQLRDPSSPQILNSQGRVSCSEVAPAFRISRGIGGGRSEVDLAMPCAWFTLRALRLEKAPVVFLGSALIALAFELSGAATQSVHSASMCGGQAQSVGVSGRVAPVATGRAYSSVQEQCADAATPYAEHLPGVALPRIRCNGDIT